MTPETHQKLPGGRGGFGGVGGAAGGPGAVATHVHETRDTRHETRDTRHETPVHKGRFGRFRGRTRRKHAYRRECVVYFTVPCPQHRWIQRNPARVRCTTLHWGMSVGTGKRDTTGVGPQGEPQQLRRVVVTSTRTAPWPPAGPRPPRAPHGDTVVPACVDRRPAWGSPRVVPSTLCTTCRTAAPSASHETKL